jgi:hypothetical protein
MCTPIEVLRIILEIIRPETLILLLCSISSRSEPSLKISKCSSLIILCSKLLVAKNIISLIYLFELLLEAFIAIGVVLLGQ